MTPDPATPWPVPSRPSRRDEAPVAMVLRALALGDLLTAVPALRGVRRALPAHRLVLAAPAGLAPLVPLIGGVDHLVPAAGLGQLPAGPGTSATDPPDVAVNLHGRGPQSTRLLAGLGPRRLVAFADPATGVPGPAWREDEHEVARWCRLVSQGVAGLAGLSGGTAGLADPLDLDLAIPDEPSPAPGAVVVHPGAGYGSRRWPVERFAAVTAALRDAGDHVVLTGGPAEADLTRAVAAAAGLDESADLGGRLTLPQLAALVAGAGLVISNDTGVAHLATAYRRPSVVLFGPAVPARWRPPPERPQHQVLWKGAGEGDRFATGPDPALLAVTVEEVLAAVDRARGVVAGPAGTPRP